MRPLMQSTKGVTLRTNARCMENEPSDPVFGHLLVCLSDEEDDKKAFIRLAASFAGKKLSSNEIIGFFNSLTRLFKHSARSDTRRIEGLFGELYTIKYLEGRGIKIKQYWQNKGNMKFDFMIDEKRRLEVKTTSNPIRSHEFGHEQLHSEIYDIVVSSVMLRPAVTGISVEDIVDYGRKIFAGDYERLMVIEESIEGWNREELEGHCYDEVYLKDNIRFFDAHNIPQFNEPTPRAVSGAKYNVDLESVEPMSELELCGFFQ
jgi:hypothetical protein